jgi:hypothetical protein
MGEAGEGRGGQYSSDGAQIVQLDSLECSLDRWLREKEERERLSSISTCDSST